MNALIFKTGVLLSFLFPLRYIQKFEYIYMYLYSGYVSRNFKFFGHSLIRGKFSSFKGGKYITIGDGVAIGKYVTLTAWDEFQGTKYSPEIIIGDGTSIGDNAHITCINRIVLGKNVLLGKKVLITDNSHGNLSVEELNTAPLMRRLYSKAEIVIGNNVWIGENCSILPGTYIGDNAIIGSNSVVTKNVPANSIAAGIPCEIIRKISE